MYKIATYILAKYVKISYISWTFSWTNFDFCLFMLRF
nr:MAG TPA: hypothetical protein [Caudoviricetes sp.]